MKRLDLLLQQITEVEQFKIRVEFKGNSLKQEKVGFTPRNAIVQVYDTRSRNLNAYLFLKNFLFGAVKSTKNANQDKYSTY